jgi:hypothetical protein
MTTTAPALDRYDVYDIAYLAGGPHQVVETALVALAESGRVTAHATGELSATDVRRRSPVEAAVLDALGSRPRRSAGTLRWLLGRDPRITDIGERLAADGLLSGRQRRFSGARPRPALTRAGRVALRRLKADPPSDHVAPGTSAMLVALTGVRAMPDAALRASLFEPPPLPRRTRVRDHGGAHSYVPTFWAGGYGGDGGGWGGVGADGGCGGGDGGGGSC